MVKIRGMVENLIILAALIMFVIADVYAVASGERLPADGFQIGLIGLLLGIWIVRVAVSRLKREAEQPDEPQPSAPIVKRDLVTGGILIAAALFVAAYGASLVDGAIGFVVGCLAHAAIRIREITGYSRRISQARASRGD
jgi:hypothetical protein